MKTPRFLWLAAILILAAPSLVRADQVIIKTPDATVGCAGDPKNVPDVPNRKMKVKIKVYGTNMPVVDAPNIPLTACWSGNDVANTLMDAIHTSAVASGYTAAGANCGSAFLNSMSLVNCAYSKPTCGFELASFMGAGTLAQEVIIWSDVSPCSLVAVTVSSNAGNWVGEGIKINAGPGADVASSLPQLLFQVNPTGTDGTHHGPLTIQGFRGPGDSVTVTIPNTASYATLSALQSAIKDAINGMGIGLIATADLSAGYSQFPTDFTPGSFGAEGIESVPSPVVRISNVQVGTEIRVKTVTGAIVTFEVGVPATPTPTPGVSPWGLLLLFGVLLLAGSWILQRGHRLAMMG